MQDEALDPVSLMVIEHACRRLVAQSAHCVDASQFNALSNVFSANARLVRPNGSVLEGREAIIAAYTSRPADRITRHLVLNTLFHSVHQASASATTRILLWATRAEVEPGPFGRPVRGPQIVGAFADTFLIEDGVWRIATRHASFEMCTVDS
ncbi:nuclear transport factor 2 family protein [Pararobbsia silviterrae]|uniref:Nuclear transport factor 2 family protein n=1 Tax=Pararobbsia silviterrae TaxID=1792498 RepID=A0A494Y7J6_9BURK|nr:nuclear transport factor 2 family protein [Pararobbsia silviterrae]RKP58672.1 nuclear transport factor 2 family protein [Pararobbsia silviterrae]